MSYLDRVITGIYGSWEQYEIDESKRFYTCCQCQMPHYDQQAIYDEHLRLQSKEGIRDVQDSSSIN